MLSDLQYLKALSLIPDLGPGRIKILFNHFGSVPKIWAAAKEELLKVEGIGSYLAERIVANRQRAVFEENLEIGSNISMIGLSDRPYPYNLLNIYDPPPILYVKGSLLPEDSLSVAIVGTRKSSHYGQETTKVIARELAKAGFTIVSGLADGIDSCAHRAALDAGGRTIAVLGSGLNTIYPYHNKELSEEIANNGALISEFSPEAPVEKWNFPRRNRIISGLSLGTLVIEGLKDSGALITARYALEQNREVFAVPGPIRDNLSTAPNSLIKQGAKLVETVQDILEELNVDFTHIVKADNPADISGFSEDERLVLKAVSNEPKHIDAICAESKAALSVVYPALTALLIAGAVKELPGKHFVVKF